MIKFINNIGDYFSSNYFDEDFTSKVLAKCGYGSDEIKEFNKRITPSKDRFFRFKQLFIEGKLRTRDKIKETHLFHTHLLNALGYDGSKTNYDNLFHFTEQEAIPVRHILYRGVQPHLMIMEMQALIKEDDNEPDGLFEQRYNVEDELQTNPPQKYHRSQWDDVFKVPEGVKISPMIINKAISALFLLEPNYRPKYILLLAGNILFLLEQEKWFRGSYLEFDLEELFTEATASPRANYYSLFYFLTSKEALAPESNMVLLDQLDEDSHKSAYEVTKDLKEGIIHAIEALANEALYYQKQVLKEEFDETDDRFEQEIKDDCLRIIYRLLFVFYAESREDLDILPSNDPIYNKGYSLELLRDLEQVPLYSETSLDGYFFHETLIKLFEVLSSGYRERENGNNKSFKVRHIDSPIFDKRKLHHLHKVKFRNRVWQDIICRLSLSKQKRGRTRGRISYANLGINQLGSVYESLLAYRGFYAEQDYIEVHKKDKPQEATYLVPRSLRDDFEEGEILKDSNAEDVILRKGTFVYRLSGRDRQKSASYYTPEVLTQSTVKYTLKPILERLELGNIKAVELLDLKLLEPAMGAAAFQNEMINQLAEAYISYRQKELRDTGRIEWKVEPDRYKEELQKVKAYIATNNVYGVDLNPTALELGKLSLWLNVIHKDMETPFFSNRICVGNAVVGAWLKVYKVKDIAEDLDSVGKPIARQQMKEWWETAPRQLEFKPQLEYDKIKHGRKQDEVYHFLLPDKNMLPSAGIKILKEENEAFLRAANTWKREWIKPLKKGEIEQLKAICNKIDELLAEYYRFQRMINSQTQSRQIIFGATKSNEQGELQMRSYDEKERMADQRNRHSAPYFKLKMVMDYWCSLWFWDLRYADQLPSRMQYWNDIASILELDTNKALEGILLKRGQQILFETNTQLSMVLEPDSAKARSETAANDFKEVVVEYTNRKDLFDNNQRLTIASELAEKYCFFHQQLEFLEVFWERGGFDLMAGNPPWISISLDDKDFVGEYLAQVFIRKTTAAKARKSLKSLLQNEMIKKEYVILDIESTSLQAFLSSANNYYLLKGQRNNLYKNILCNCLISINRNGSWGLIFPETVYEDPDSGILRSMIFKHLRYHYHFINQTLLFSEVDNQVSYSLNIFKGIESEIYFDAIFNLFHPSTIEQCYINNSNKEVSLKTRNVDGQYTWNLLGSNERRICIDKLLLKKIYDITEHYSGDFTQTNLLRLHTNSIIPILEKIKQLKGKIKDESRFITDGLNDTTSFDNQVLTKLFINNPVIDNLELVIAGPNFYISTPWYKSIRIGMKSNRDYDFFILPLESESSLPNSSSKATSISVVKSTYINCLTEGDSWLDYYRLVFSKMLNLGSMRTLQPSIIPPNIPHVSNAISIVFKSQEKLIEICGLTSSIIYDFYIKSLGKENLYPETIDEFRLGLDKRFMPYIASRILRMNCQTIHFSDLWSANFKDEFKKDDWHKSDHRLSPYCDLSKSFIFNTTPLKNDYERRYALVELDIIIAFALNLCLDDLINIYKIYFPVNQQYEDNTFYDAKGNIIFTINKGLPDVGIERSLWEQISTMQSGETYTHTITKSERYQGKQITYHAPFDKCDRVEDYKVAWEHFEKVFKNNEQ